MVTRSSAIAEEQRDALVSIQ